MNFDLADHPRLLRQTVREFAGQEIAPVAGELDRTKAFPYEIIRRLGELDLMGVPFPEEYGGAGGDSLAYALVVEELTRGDPSGAVSRWAPTPRWAPSRSTCSGPRSRSTSGCPSCAAASAWGRSG